VHTPLLQIIEIWNLYSQAVPATGCDFTYSGSQAPAPSHGGKPGHGDERVVFISDVSELVNPAKPPVKPLADVIDEVDGNAPPKEGNVSACLASSTDWCAPRITAYSIYS
jgi:hypothetical protein